MATTADSTTRLDDFDRQDIAKARALAGLKDPDAVRQHTGSADLAMAYVKALGEAQVLLRRLAAIAEHLGSS